MFKAELLATTADGRRRFGLADGHGGQIRTDLLSVDRIHPIRDANGDLWVGPRRWDGEQWQLVVPDYHCERLPHMADASKVELDEAGKSWRVVHSGVPLDVTGFDLKARTGWIGGNGKPVQFVQFAQDGSPDKVLRTIKASGLRDIRPPTVRGQDGSWWGLAAGPGGGTVVYRFRPDDQLVMLSATDPKFPREGEPSEVVLSPKGKLWVVPRQFTASNIMRIDEEKNEAVAEYPRDDFGVEFVGRTIGVIGQSYQTIMIRRAGQWTFWNEGGVADSNAAFWVWGAYWPRMLRGNRMLANVGPNVVAYDAVSYSQAYLLSSRPGEVWKAFFDRLGRTILVRGEPAACALVYDGDPFASSPPAPGELEFNRLMAQLNDPKWSAREAAAEELRRRAGEFRPLLAAAMSRADLSDEARLRLEPIVEALNSPAAPRQTLFDRMNPPLLGPERR